MRQIATDGHIFSVIYTHMHMSCHIMHVSTWVKVDVLDELGLVHVHSILYISAVSLQCPVSAIVDQQHAKAAVLSPD